MAYKQVNKYKRRFRKKEEPEEIQEIKEIPEEVPKVEYIEEEPEEIEEIKNDNNNLDLLDLEEIAELTRTEEIKEIPEEVPKVEYIEEEPEEIEEFNELPNINIELDSVMVLLSYVLTVYIYYRLKSLEKANKLAQEIENENKKILERIAEKLKLLIDKYSQRSKLINGMASNLQEIVFLMDLITFMTNIETKIQNEIKEPEPVPQVLEVPTVEPEPNNKNLSLKEQLQAYKGCDYEQNSIH
ncbi:hypothetical protein [Methanococcus voltae]|uniref:Uncharacterized protein n=1 Tax=Methanococcus voltae (strain ATCC BAA-1334 / A3) TaxID=456320 RepID=D7DSL6_METV3|nr:hypothetical protein [Methanococcus voltae]MCS3901725.1 uncharacterized protein (UPF0333 family) [Methanococcus voltae]